MSGTVDHGDVDGPRLSLGKWEGDGYVGVKGAGAGGARGADESRAAQCVLCVHVRERERERERVHWWVKQAYLVIHIPNNEHPRVCTYIG